MREELRAVQAAVQGLRLELAQLQQGPDTPPAVHPTWIRAKLERRTHEQRRLVFPNSTGKVTRYGAFSKHVWRPLLAATKLPYRKPHAMRHSYATWLLEAGAGIRWVQRQLGHATIAQTSDTYGHLESERHEARVDLDEVLDIVTVPIEAADLRLTTRVNLDEVRAAECSEAFTTRSEVSHEKR